jgi:hypothetical protein
MNGGRRRSLDAGAESAFQAGSTSKPQVPSAGPQVSVEFVAHALKRAVGTRAYADLFSLEKLARIHGKAPHMSSATLQQKHKAEASKTIAPGRRCKNRDQKG